MVQIQAWLPAILSEDFWSVFRCVCKIVKSDYQSCHVRPSICPPTRNYSAPSE